MAISGKSRSAVFYGGVPQASELPAAVVVNAIPGDPNGLIPTEYLYHPIKIQLEKIWRFPALDRETDYVHFYIKPHTPEPEYPLPPIPLQGPLTQEKDFPVELSIGGNWLKISGSYDIRYEVDGPGGLEQSPHTRTFTIDWIAPGGSAPMLPATFVDPEIAEFGVTEEYLSTHPTIEVLIPTYFDRQPFDEVPIFLLSSEDANPFEAVYIHTFTSSTEPLKVPVPSSAFRTLQSGPRALRYTLRDRAGNQRLDYSGPTPVYIDLDPAPSGLKPLSIVAYDYDGRVDRGDARQGVTVHFGAYFDWKSTDDVVVSWNGIVLAREPVTGFPKTVAVDWATLIQKGYVQTHFPVQYFIYRAGSSDGVPSPIRYIDADFRVAGQDHEDAPAEYNRHLAKVEISGGGSDTPNHLDFNDVDKPVTARVVLFDDPKVGQWMDLYWGDVEEAVARYQVKAGDVAGAIVTFPLIEWSAIADHIANNPAFPVTYRTSNGVNEQLAPSQTVNINIVPPVKFPPPEFLHAENSWLNCQTSPPLWEGVHVRVNKHIAIQDKDELRLRWQGTLGFAGNRPIPETSEVFVEPWAPIDDTRGYHDFIVPYLPYVQPMKDNGGAMAEFSVWRKGVRVGSSQVRYVKIDRKFATSPPVYCGPGGPGPEGAVFK